jgi:hypothetical protein
LIPGFDLEDPAQSKPKDLFYLLQFIIVTTNGFESIRDHYLGAIAASFESKLELLTQMWGRSRFFCHIILGDRDLQRRLTNGGCFMLFGTKVKAQAMLIETELYGVAGPPPITGGM